MSAVARRWSAFANSREIARGRKERFPGSSPCEGSMCPLHEVALGVLTKMCLACHEQAWAWTGDRFLEHESLRETS